MSSAIRSVATPTPAARSNGATRRPASCPFVKYPSGNQATYQYDANGILQKISGSRRVRNSSRRSTSLMPRAIPVSRHRQPGSHHP